MDIVLLGPPGAGKGTQGDLLARRLAVPKIATGDVLRAAVREGTPLGREAKAAMDRGDLVPDSVILGIMKETLASKEARAGSILDGVVRTVPQAEGLERVLRELGRRVDAVVLFEADEDELVHRLSSRTTCEACQTPYKDREPGTACDECGGKLVRRRDDEPEAVRNRLGVYRRQTEPVIEWYRSNGVNVVPVNAVGTVHEVTKRVLDALGQ
ncbi:MAG TPA: adenylate kinase [Gemmatimonadaceae bacterium]|nr:adenylate kinase [Gemmatimonadaceae bacterium]